MVKQKRMRGITLVTIVLLGLLNVGIASLEKSTTEGSLSTTSGSVENELSVEEKWMRLERKVQSLSNEAVKMILPRVMEFSQKVNLSSTCMKETMLVIGGAKKLKLWAIRMIDASAKMVDGILTGTMSSFGAYDQCLSTEAIDERSRTRGKVLFRGKYCALDLKPPLPPKKNFYKLNEVLEELRNFSKRETAISEAAKYAHFFYFLSFRLGLCVPSGCSINDINQVAKMVGDYLYFNATTRRCEVKEDIEITQVMVFVFCAFGFMGLLMVIGTSIDIFSYLKKRVFKNIFMKILLAFSFISNFKKLVNTKTSSDTLSCLNGVRFLCMSWIVLGHTYLNVNYQLFIGLESVRSYAEDFAFQAIVNASVAVDTFFFIGGFLVCYLTVKIVKEHGKPMNIKLYIFHRLWRIIPVYAYVIAFMFLADILGNGPIWHDTTEYYVQACRDNWWTNFLFINNFYRADHMCIPQSWYIASDMQLYVVALAVLLPLLRWPKLGISIAVLGVLGSMLFSGIGTYLNDYPPTMLFVHPDPQQRITYWATFYFKPYVHAGPYFIGMLAGYLLVTKPKLQISKGYLVLGWAAAAISNLAVLYGVYEWNRGRDPTFWENMMYSSCNRVAWTFGVAWMIVCCATGHGGIINYILSWKAWIPLGRLTFVVYLIHPLVQIIVIGNVRAQVQPQHFFAVWVYFGHLCVTYGIGFAGSMLVEAPFLALEKLLIPKEKIEEKTNPANHVNFKGQLKIEKNGDIGIVPDIDGIDNKSYVSKL